MRTFKGLENIHSVIDRHVAEWRKEQGEPEEEIKELSLEENVRRRLTTSSNPNSKAGQFSADRFLGTMSMTKSKQDSKKSPESTPQSEQQLEIEESAPADRSEAESTLEESEEASDVEIISVIKHQDNKPHSWLYNEVVKAINDAKGAGKNTKVVAIFIPVVQNGKEFEDLPVDDSVTLSPVNEEAIKVEEPVEPVENDKLEVNEAVSEAPEILEQILVPVFEPETEQEIDQVEQEAIDQEPEETQESEANQDSAPVDSLAPEKENEAEAEAAEEESEEAEIEVEETKPLEATEENNVASFDLLPEGPGDNDEELADAFQVMEEKLDEQLHEQEQTNGNEIEEADQADSVEEVPEPEELSVIDPVIEPEEPVVGIEEYSDEDEDKNEEDKNESETESKSESESQADEIAIEDTENTEAIEEIEETEPESVGEVMNFTEIETQPVQLSDESAPTDRDITVLEISDEESNSEENNERVNELEDVEVIEETESGEVPELLPLPDSLEDDEVFEDDAEFEDPLVAINRLNELAEVEHDDEMITLEEREEEENNNENEKEYEDENIKL